MSALAVWVPPRSSEALSAAVARVAAGKADNFAAPPRVIAEAGERAARLRHHLAARDASRAAAWLLELAEIMPNAPAHDALRLAVPALVDVLDLPPMAWTRETLRAAAGELRFWPSAAELRPLLSAPVRDALVEVAALEHIAGHVEREPFAPPPDDERDAALARSAAMRAELAALAEANAPPAAPVRPGHLDRATLAAVYAAQGINDPRSQP
jgi:hypothetical protein